MRWLACAFLIIACDQGERTPPPAPATTTVTRTYGPDSFIQLDAQTISDMNAPRDRRVITITGDGKLSDYRESQTTRTRQISSRQFVELVHELERVGFLTQSSCGSFDHGRHTTLTLSVPQGRKTISDATMCHALRGPVDQILELADSPVE
jgi:hypothetical protein